MKHVGIMRVSELRGKVRTNPYNIAGVDETGVDEKRVDEPGTHRGEPMQSAGPNSYYADPELRTMYTMNQKYLWCRTHNNLLCLHKMTTS